MQYFTVRKSLPTDRHDAVTAASASHEETTTNDRICVLCMAQNKMQIIRPKNSSHETSRKWRKLWSLTKIDCDEIHQFTILSLRYWRVYTLASFVLRAWDFRYIVWRTHVTAQRIFDDKIPVRRLRSTSTSWWIKKKNWMHRIRTK